MSNTALLRVPGPEGMKCGRSLIGEITDFALEQVKVEHLSLCRSCSPTAGQFSRRQE